MSPRKGILAGVALLGAMSAGPALGQDADEGTFAPLQLMDDTLFWFLQADQFEHRWNGEAEDTFSWEAQGWLGGDLNRAWLKTEGVVLTEGDPEERVEEAELQLLYSRLIGPFTELQIGARHDFEPDPSRTYAVVGVQALAPYLFEVDTAVFLSRQGELSARLEAEYELLFTQRLIAQPRFELNLSAEDVEERGIGRGVNDIDLGLRLRYEIRREFAPYVGVNWTKKIGNTADFAEEEGEDDSTFAVLAGIRFWF